MFPIHVRTASGLEKILAQELSGMGLSLIQTRNRLVTGIGELKTLYKINLWSRTAIRVLRLLETFPAPDEDAFYKKVKSIDWSPWLTSKGTLAVDAHVHSSFTTHSLFLAQLTKDAIADQFREKTGDRPSVSLENPDLRIAVNLYKNTAEILIDSSGESLHKRGYRKKSGEAPLNETLAAGIVLLSGWNGDHPLVDPMTGSGTLAIEAGLLAKNIAPGLLRRTFGFQKWNDYDPSLFETLVEEAKKAIRKEPISPILAFDKDSKMLPIALENIERAGLKDTVQVEKGDFFEWDKVPEAPGNLLMNPPYDERLPVEDMAQFCLEMGQRLKKQYPGWRAYLLMGNKEAAKEIGIPPRQVWPLWNGAIECDLFEFVLHKDQQPELATSSEINPKWKAKQEAFANRLKKNLKHHSKWAQRERVTCWRIYDRDIPELPFVVDLFGRNLHFAEVPRNHDHSPLEHRRYLELMQDTAAGVIQIPRDKVFFKTRKAQKLPKTETSAPIEVREGKHKFLINLIDYVDVGLPLEFRKVREWIENESQGKDFLNLFSYTGTATVCAAAGGAKSTGSVDSSSTYLDWAKKNMELNGLKGSQHMFYRSDIYDFLNSSQKVYDLVWIDPPVHSINRNTGTEFNVQEDHVDLIGLALKRTGPKGRVLFTTHCESFELKEWALKEAYSISIQELTHKLTPQDFEKSRPFRAWLFERT